MTRAHTRRSYATRIEQVVEYLLARLDQPLTLAQLAEVGHFSAYHFHRIYRGMMGETVEETRRRLRLHRAAVELIQGEGTLEAIARGSGYGSLAAFSRAFAAAYGRPPGEFRRRRGSGIPALPRHPCNDQEHSDMYDVDIRELAPLDVAAIRHSGPYHAIGDAFGKLGIWLAARGRRLGQERSFGIYYDDPEATPPEKLVSDACIEIAGDLPLDATVEKRRIAGGRYAVLVHTGPYAELETPYRWLFGEWLPASGEEAADAPVIEEYLNDPHSLPPTEWRTAICLPLR